MLPKVIYPDFKEKLDNVSKGDSVWNTSEPLQSVLVLLLPMIKVNGKLQHPNLGRTANLPYPSEISVWITLLGSKPLPAEVLDDGKGNTDSVVKEVN